MNISSESETGLKASGSLSYFHSPNLLCVNLSRESGPLSKDISLILLTSSFFLYPSSDHSFELRFLGRISAVTLTLWARILSETPSAASQHRLLRSSSKILRRGIR